MKRAWVAMAVFAACGAGNPQGDAGVDAGIPDAGVEDAGIPDAGRQVITLRDAGTIIVDSRLPWSWQAVTEVLATAPSAGGLRSRWVDVSPFPVDRAWAGGVLLFDGGVVAIPYNEAAVLVIHPGDDTSVRWPITGGAVEGGWEGGVLLPDGTVIAIPRNASRFLRIDPRLGTAVPFGDDLSDSGVDGGQDKFNGGVLGLNGLVYAAPSAAAFVARLDPSTGAVTRLPVPAPFLRGSTHGGVVFPTGDIVMFPQADTPGLLVVPSRDGGVDELWLLPRPPLSGPAAFCGGGVITDVDTAIAAPQQNTRPLRYSAGLFSWEPAVPGLTEQMSHAYYFAAWSTDGHIYAPPYGGDQVIRFGVDGTTRVPVDGFFFRAVFGAVGLADGRIIGIPHSRGSWLELAPEGRRTVPMEAMTSPYLNKL